MSLSDGSNLGPHQTGELYLRGPQIMKGYLNNETATRETLVEDGYLRTGDVAYYDKEGFFFIVDRTKELIKVKGNQVSVGKHQPSFYRVVLQFYLSFLKKINPLRVEHF